MAKKDFTITSKILMTMLAAGDMFIVTPGELRKRLWRGKPLGDNKSFYSRRRRVYPLLAKDKRAEELRKVQYLAACRETVAMSLQ